MMDLLGEMLCAFGFHSWRIVWHKQFMFDKRWQLETVKHLVCNRCGTKKQLGL